MYGCFSMNDYWLSHRFEMRVSEPSEICTQTAATTGHKIQNILKALSELSFLAHPAEIFPFLGSLLTFDLGEVQTSIFPFSDVIAPIRSSEGFGKASCPVEEANGITQRFVPGEMHGPKQFQN